MHCLWNLYSRIDASLCWDRSSTALASKPSSNATNRCSPFFTQTGSHQVLSAPTYMAECLTGVSAGTAKANQVRYFSWPAYLLTCEQCCILYSHMILSQRTIRISQCLACSSVEKAFIHSLTNQATNPCVTML